MAFGYRQPRNQNPLLGVLSGLMQGGLAFAQQRQQARLQEQARADAMEDRDFRRQVMEADRTFRERSYADEQARLGRLDAERAEDRTYRRGMDERNETRDAVAKGAGIYGTSPAILNTLATGRTPQQPSLPAPLPLPGGGTLALPVNRSLGVGELFQGMRPLADVRREQDREQQLADQQRGEEAAVRRGVLSHDLQAIDNLMLTYPQAKVDRGREVAFAQARALGQPAPAFTDTIQPPYQGLQVDLGAGGLQLPARAGLGMRPSAVVPPPAPRVSQADITAPPAYQQPYTSIFARPQERGPSQDEINQQQALEMARQKAAAELAATNVELGAKQKAARDERYTKAVAWYWENARQPNADEAHAYATRVADLQGGAPIKGGTFAAAKAAVDARKAMVDEELGRGNLSARLDANTIAALNTDIRLAELEFKRAQQAGEVRITGPDQARLNAISSQRAAEVAKLNALLQKEADWVKQQSAAAPEPGKPRPVSPYRALIEASEKESARLYGAMEQIWNRAGTPADPVRGQVLSEIARAERLKGRPLTEAERNRLSRALRGQGM